jgi:hypothetical protein
LKFSAIILLSIAAAVVYGIVRDQVTARICVEYFTIGHPTIFDTKSPTLLGLGWGIIATWWVGLILGVPLAVAARCGRRPVFTVRRLVRPLIGLLGCMACTAIIAGVVGYLAASAGVVILFEPLASRVPADRHVAFLTDLWAHCASYGSGFLGGLILIRWVWRARAKLADL